MTSTEFTDHTQAIETAFAARLAEIEAAEAAPESFDPIAAIRRVEALAEELLEETTEATRLARAYKQAGKWAGGAVAEAKAWTSGDAAARLRAALRPADVAGDGGER